MERRKNGATRGVTTQTADDIADALLERWLGKLDRDTSLDKWDRLMGLVGHPTEMFRRSGCLFDRDLLEKFDTARHDATHRSGRVLEAFDLPFLEVHMVKAVFGITAHVAKSNGIFIVPDVISSLLPEPPKISGTR